MSETSAPAPEPAKPDPHPARSAEELERLQRQIAAVRRGLSFRARILKCIAWICFAATLALLVFGGQKIL